MQKLTEDNKLSKKVELKNGLKQIKNHNNKIKSLSSYNKDIINNILPTK